MRAGQGFQAVAETISLLPDTGLCTSLNMRLIDILGHIPALRANLLAINYLEVAVKQC